MERAQQPNGPQGDWVVIVAVNGKPMTPPLSEELLRIARETTAERPEMLWSAGDDGQIVVLQLVAAINAPNCIDPVVQLRAYVTQWVRLNPREVRRQMDRLVCDVIQAMKIRMGGIGVSDLSGSFHQDQESPL